MQKCLTRAFLGAVLVFFFSGCDLLGGMGEYHSSGENKEGKSTEPPPFFELLEGENAPPNPVIPPTDGTEFLYKNEDVFGRLSEGIKSLFRESRSDTIPRAETEVGAYQVMQMTSYREIAHRVKSLDSPFLTEHQLIEFVRQNREWIRAHDWRNFALIKIEDEVTLVSILGHHVRFEDPSDQTMREVTPVKVGSGPDSRISGYYWRVIVPKQE